MSFGKDFRVMMIDGDAPFLVTLADALRNIGITNILKATSGAEAALTNQSVI